MNDVRGRRDEILDAATGLFARLGYKKTTLDEVAGEVGIVKSALYRYFDNKEQLFNGMIDRIVRAHMDAAEAAVKGAKGTEVFIIITTEWTSILSILLWKKK